MTTYISKDGDTVDEIAWRYYGYQDKQTVEQVLAANPGLADSGPLLPPGLRVELPELVTPVDLKGIRLWT